MQYNPHAEILERFNKVETLINYLINGGSPNTNQPIQFTAPLTRQESAAHLGISLPTLDQLIKSGELRAFNIGRQVRIKWSDLEDYLNNKSKSNK